MAMFKNLIKRISNGFRGTIHVIGSLFGVKWKGEWCAQGLITTGWVFLIGIPIGMLLVGAEIFSVSLWLGFVLLALMIVNIDDSLNMMSNYITYGVDGEETCPYERTQ